MPVPHIARVAIDLIRGVDQQKQMVLENTTRFARGFPANNAMLWGARGMGKSSLVKADPCRRRRGDAGPKASARPSSSRFTAMTCKTPCRIC